MPRKSQKRNQTQMDESSSDDENASTSATQSKVSKPENFDELVANTVKHVLSLSVNKVPFRRTDIVKATLNNENKCFPMVFEKVTEILESIYDAKVHEYKTQDKHLYLITSSNHLHSIEQLKRHQKAEMILRHMILSFVFMKGGEVTDTSIWEFLNLMDIYHEKHEFFGDAKKLVDDTFFKQMYLSREKVQIEQTNEHMIMISWGIRAQLEYQKKDIFEDSCALVRQPTCNFMKQFDEVYGDVQPSHPVEI